ncbi:HNH endonuclease [Brucella sp. RRSP16]|uniref:HNH endonuclease n=1 Tax=Brucella TaxID=234 RepID=UPI0033057A46
MAGDEQAFLKSAVSLKNGELMITNGLSWASIRPLIAPSVWAKTNGKCYYCGEKLADIFDVEHLIPQSRGGSHALKNLVPSCKPCNREKGAKSLEDWRDYKHMLVACRDYRLPSFNARQVAWLRSQGFEPYATVPKPVFWFERALEAQNDNTPLAAQVA